jgi:hypothetical protein
MAGSGTTALGSDINTPYSTGVNVMGTGSVSRGYGQTTFGNSKNTGDTISANDFNNIRYDLLNASAHQNGSAVALSLAGNVSGQLINSTDPDAFLSYASTVDSDRFNCHSSRKTTVSAGGNSRTSSWASSVSGLFQMIFSSAAQARYFWNGGGRIRFSSSRTGGAASAQNTSWSSLLSSAGTQEFGGSAVYGWSNVGVTLYSISSSAPYASNTYRIEAATNVNNASGGANIFLFNLNWSDPYVDPMPGAPPLPEDIVDGTLSYSVEITYPTGGHALTPSGTWTSYREATSNAGSIIGG